MLEPDGIDRQRHFRSQLLIALEAAGFDGVAYGLLDLALGGDANALEESAQAFVEDVLVHDGPPWLMASPDCSACLRRDCAAGARVQSLYLHRFYPDVLSLGSRSLPFRTVCGGCCVRGVGFVYPIQNQIGRAHV